MIRQATLRDADAIAAVHVASWEETYTGLLPSSYIANLDLAFRERMWKNILTEKNNVYIYETEDKIVGFVHGGKLREEKDLYKGEIYALYLLKKYQQRGIGGQLFEHIQLILATQGLRPFTTWVLASNPSLEFYRKLGAEIIGERVEIIDGLAVKDLQLGWN